MLEFSFADLVNLLGLTVTSDEIPNPHFHQVIKNFAEYTCVT